MDWGKVLEDMFEVKKPRALHLSQETQMQESIAFHRETQGVSQESIAFHRPGSSLGFSHQEWPELPQRSASVAFEPYPSQTYHGSVPALTHIYSTPIYRTASPIYRPSSASPAPNYESDMSSAVTIDSPTTSRSSNDKKRAANYLGLPKMPLDAFIPIRTADGLLQYQCTSCPKFYTRRGTNAKSHWMWHENLKGYKCNKCDASFTRRANLDKHTCKRE